MQDVKAALDAAYGGDLLTEASTLVDADIVVEGVDHNNWIYYRPEGQAEWGLMVMGSSEFGGQGIHKNVYLSMACCPIPHPVDNHVFQQQRTYLKMHLAPPEVSPPESNFVWSPDNESDNSPWTVPMVHTLMHELAHSLLSSEHHPPDGCPLSGSSWQVLCSMLEEHNQNWPPPAIVTTDRTTPQCQLDAAIDDNQKPTRGQSTGTGNQAGPR